jgi:hypothetical protein
MPSGKSRPTARSRREGFEYSRILLSREALAKFVPQAGWKIESFGFPFEAPQSLAVAVNLRRDLPPVPRADTILGIVARLLSGSGQEELISLASRLRLGQAELDEMLTEAGLPPAGSPNLRLLSNDRYFWRDAEGRVHCRQREPGWDDRWSDEDDWRHGDVEWEDLAL